MLPKLIINFSCIVKEQEGICVYEISLEKRYHRYEL